MHDLDRHRAKRILLTQLATILVLSLPALVYSSSLVLAVVIGGGIAAGGTAIFAARVFSRYQAREPGRLLARLFGAELIKLLFVAACFAAVFIWVPEVNVPALFGAFLLVQVIPPLLANRVAK